MLLLSNNGQLNRTFIKALIVLLCHLLNKLNNMKRKYKLKENIKYKHSYLLTDTFKSVCNDYMFNNLSLLTPEQKDFIVRLQQKESLTERELRFLKTFTPITETLHRGIEFISDKRRMNYRWEKCNK